MTKKFLGSIGQIIRQCLLFFKLVSLFVVSGETVAVKVMEIALDKEEDIKAELNVFQNHAHHPNIVDFYGAFVKRNELADDHLWIVMEVKTVEQ